MLDRPRAREISGAKSPQISTKFKMSSWPLVMFMQPSIAQAPSDFADSQNTVRWQSRDAGVAVREYRGFAASYCVNTCRVYSHAWLLTVEVCTVCDAFDQVSCGRLARRRPRCQWIFLHRQIEKYICSLLAPAVARAFTAVACRPTECASLKQ